MFWGGLHSRLLKEIIKDTKLPEHLSGRVVINVATTFTNVLKQVKTLLDASSNVVSLNVTKPKSQRTRGKVQELKSSGMKQKEVTEALQMSVRTVKTYWNEVA